MNDKEMKFNDKTDLAIALSDAFGVSGMEDEVIETAKEYIKENCGDSYDFIKEPIKNLFILPKFADTSKPAILLDAHSDEVGFMVQCILDNGMIRFLPLGGWNLKNIISCPVKIKTRKNGEVKAIVATIPPHFKSGPETELVIEDLVVDPGTSSKEETLNLGIKVGDFIIPDVKCMYDRDRELFIGKAFDCRIGCTALLEVLNRLGQNIKCDANVIGLLSSQEEVGTRGIKAAVKRILENNVQMAICFEGCPADDTFLSQEISQTKLGKGPMLRYLDKQMITSPAYQDFALETAEKYGIPVQVAVRKGGSTNGSILHTNNIPTIVIGIPVRYAHSSIGFTSKRDLDAAVELALKIIQTVTEDDIKRF